MAEEVNRFPLVGQQESWAHWQRLLASGRFGHAHIIHGKSGIGKDALAFRIAAALNCQSETAKPCGECPPCQQIAALEFPSLFLVYALPRKASSKTDPLEGLSEGDLADITEELGRKAAWPYYRLQIADANDIRISAIRKLRTDIYLSNNPGERKLVVILRAHKMNQEAANALLKILEEPPSGAVFVLTTEYPERLPDTIRSRCQLHQLHDLPWSVIKEYLAAEGVSVENAELAARLSQGDLELAKMFSGEDSRTWLKLTAQVMNALQGDDFGSIYTLSAILQDKNLFDDQRRQRYLSLLILFFRDLAVGIRDDDKSIWPVDIEGLHDQFPDMHAAEMVREVEKCKDSLERKVYLPLALTTLFLGLRRQLRGIGKSMIEELAAS